MNLFHYSLVQVRCPERQEAINLGIAGAYAPTGWLMMTLSHPIPVVERVFGTYFDPVSIQMQLDTCRIWFQDTRQRQFGGELLPREHLDLVAFGNRLHNEVQLTPPRGCRFEEDSCFEAELWELYKRLVLPHKHRELQQGPGGGYGHES